ncbi:alpha/beta hydrolase-fold protein [Pedobacter sp. P26]|uniref:alpha/beta hydrolase-fold protein n=1 Tax=Pedobacter sp. P26 TaxID=3423956 RepID=UPI003D679799
MKNSFLITACLFLFSHVLSAAEVDTALTYSKSMNKTIKAVVIKPDSYKTGKKFPVVYLLHGAGGTMQNGLKKYRGLKTWPININL